MWKIIPPEDNHYMIQNRWSGLHLGIVDSSETDEAKCIQMSDDESDNVKWCFLVTE